MVDGINWYVTISLLKKGKLIDGHDINSATTPPAAGRSIGTTPKHHLSIFPYRFNFASLNANPLKRQQVLLRTAFLAQMVIVSRLLDRCPAEPISHASDSIASSAVPPKEGVMLPGTVVPPLQLPCPLKILQRKPPPRRLLLPEHMLDHSRKAMLARMGISTERDRESMKGTK